MLEMRYLTSPDEVSLHMEILKVRCSSIALVVDSRIAMHKTRKALLEAVRQIRQQGGVTHAMIAWFFGGWLGHADLAGDPHPRTRPRL